MQLGGARRVALDPLPYVWLYTPLPYVWLYTLFLTCPPPYVWNGYMRVCSFSYVLSSLHSSDGEGENGGGGLCNRIVW